MSRQNLGAPTGAVLGAESELDARAADHVGDADDGVLYVDGPGETELGPPATSEDASERGESPRDA